MKKKSEFTCPARAKYVAPALECTEFETEHGIAASSTVNVTGSGIGNFSEDNTYGGTSWY